MPTADGPRRAGTRAAAAAPSQHDGHRRGRATIQARLRAAPRSAWRSGTPRRPLSRRGRRIGRRNVPMCGRVRFWSIFGGPRRAYLGGSEEMGLMRELLMLLTTACDTVLSSRCCP